MSLLQLKNIHKRHLLWAKIVGICLFVHLIFLFWIFCVYRDNSYMLSLSINKNLDYSTPIFFVPLGVATAHVKPVAPQKNIPKKTTASTKQPISVITPKPASSFAKASEDKQKKPTTVAASIPKKIEPIKEEIKKVEPVKQEVAKVEPKKEVKKEIEKIVEKNEPSVAQALDIEQTIVPPSFAEASEGTAVVPENAHVSHDYREVEALRKQAQLQKEIVQTWKPPIGVSPDCMCEVSFFVNSTGKIEDIKMIKGSGVMMFDISARQALFATKMPQWTYGKPFTINFRQ